MIATIKSNLNQALFPICEKEQCPFHGCMSDNTCKIYNVKESAPHLIEQFAPLIDYCNRPLLSLKNENK